MLLPSKEFKCLLKYQELTYHFSHLGKLVHPIRTECVQINMNDKYAIFEEAKMACKNEGRQPENHFEEVHEMVTIRPSTRTHVKGDSLSSYACRAIMGVVGFMVSQNAIPSRKYLAFFKMNIETFNLRSQVVTSRG